MKISIGVITKNFNSLEPIDEFLENASKYNHEIYSVIIIYSHGCDFRLVEGLEKNVSSYEEYRPPLVIRKIFKIDETYLI